MKGYTTAGVFLCELFFISVRKEGLFMVIINGKTVTFDVPTTVGNYLDENNYRRQRIAVELNGEILSKTAYDTTFFTEGDKVEIVSFVGGG
jgi:sulfur carrier protein